MILRTLKIIGYGLLGLLGLVVLVAIFAITPPGENIIAGILEDQLSSAFGYPVSIDDFRWNLVSHAEVSDFSVGTQSGEGPSAFISRLYVTYSLHRLLFKDIQLGEILVDSVNLAIIRDSSGTLQLPIKSDTSASPPTSDTSSGGFTFSFDTLSIAQLGIRYTDNDLDINADIVRSDIHVGGGENDTYRYAISIDSTAGSYSGVELPGVRLVSRGAAGQKEIRIDTLAIQTDSLDLDASATIWRGNTDSIAARLVLTGDPSLMMQRAGHIYNLPEIKTKGNLDAGFHVGGPVTSPRVNTRATLPAVDVGSVSAGQSRLVLTYANDSLHVDSMTISAFDGTVRGNGLVVLDSSFSGALSLSLSSLQIGSMLSAVYSEAPQYRGTLGGSVTATLEGSAVSGWRAEADLDISNIRYHQHRLPDMTASLSYKNGHGNLSIAQQEFALKASADLTAKTLDGSFDLNIPELDLVTGWIGVDSLYGRLSVQGSLAGTPQAPEISASVSGDSIRYYNFPVDTLSSTLTYRDTVFRIETASIAGGLDSINLFYPIFGLDSLRGGFRYHATVSGTTDSLHGEATASLDSLRYEQFGADSGTIELTITGKTFTVTDATFYQDTAAITAQGHFSLDSMAGALSARVLALTAFDSPGSSSDSSKVAAEPVAPGVGKLSAMFDFSDTTSSRVSARGDSLYLQVLSVLGGREQTFRGRMAFEADFEGSMRHPHGNLRVTVDRPAYKDVALDSLALSGSINDSALTLDTLSAFGMGHELALNARVELDRDTLGNVTVDSASSIDGRILARDIGLSLLEPFLPDNTAVGGKATVDLTWGGTLADPHANGTVSIDSSWFAPGPDIDTIRNVTARLTLQDSVLKVSRLTGDYKGSRFAVDGSITVSDWDTYSMDLELTTEKYGAIRAAGSLSGDNIDITANLDTLRLALFAEFVPMVDSLSGWASAQLHVTGTRNQPEVTGELQARNIAVKPTVMDSTIHGGVLIVSYRNSELHLDSLFARVGKGYVTASGNATVDKNGLTSVDLLAGVRSASLSGDNLFNLQVDTANFTYRDADNGYALNGWVSLGKTKFTKNLDVEQILPWAKTVERVQTEAAPWQRNTRIDIRVTKSDSIWIDNNLARLRLQADIEVIGTIANPNVTGRVAVQEGYVSYVDRKFTVQQGTLFFTNPNRFNPDVNLTATTSVTDYQGMTPQVYDITFAAQGQLDQLRTSLTSDPPLGEPDIISLLTVGTTRQQLAGGQANTGQVLAERAERIGSRQITNFASRRVADVLGLESLNVEGNIFSSGGQGTGPSISATKQLSEKIRLTYSTVVGAMNEQTIQIEYLWTDHWSVEGQTDRAGNSLINLLYRIKFK